MQLDMHYYGTYAMARAAGLKPEVATTIATAAQFVDDNAADNDVDFKDGGKFLTEATAHHLASTENFDNDDQRQVWVPFHFLPGGEGESYGEKLLCRKDSANAQSVLSFALSLSDRNYAPELIGATAHIYADTFAHYDFSGVSSPWNYIDNSTLTILNENDFAEELKEYNKQKEKSFFENFTCLLPDSLTGGCAETLSCGLGHGAACTHPDRPYLHWSFVREETGDTIEHNNIETFTEASEALHTFFTDFAKHRPDLCENDPMEFSEIKAAVREVIMTPADKSGRISAWQQACKAGKITGHSETIPEYSSDGWNDERNMLNHTEFSPDAVQHSAYRFYQAAALLRTYILRDLLPSQGLIVA
ncbi:DUF6765 family protein [Halodesulfovibrio spirochaetisodalis]|uniref:Uncharacterized protein n=1 Tax=Halodesulfovibrio spirochaetisodalis TaxID=1560234 RepID=A0A1B7XJR1_9BACT|nr:DUF6765 family protein [Halodesulfovibrio spirochaetisodalis]OBQ55739.1 hypothetical protein SP90_03730 [Halodesulfovibrio spirochaetisodalis]